MAQRDSLAITSRAMHVNVSAAADRLYELLARERDWQRVRSDAEKVNVRVRAH